MKTRVHLFKGSLVCKLHDDLSFALLRAIF